MHRNVIIAKLANVIWTTPSKRYLAYLRSPTWFARRRDHLSTYSSCQMPGCWRPAIQVHHWHYRTLGDERPQDLCSVCVDCHHRIHLMPEAANDNKQLELPLPAALRSKR